ncbi:MAG: DUF362 domain-containing protein [Candidatus Hodarchaeales archaeon]
MSKVAILHTQPKTILEDYSKLLDIIDYQSFLNKKINTIIKINLSWSLFYPACSTPPWQLDGVLKKLISDGFTNENIIPVENQTVVTNPWKGAYLNKWNEILKKYGTTYRPLTDEEWIKYNPKADVPAMRELFKDNIIIPKIFLNSNVIHLPTVKTHGHTTITGALKNAFGGLIPKYRHHSHRVIHEILVDLLAIQKEIHPGMLAVTDGTVSGNGAGPRVMEPVITNIIMASEDQVAIDAIAAKIMGFDPMKIKFIKMAHDQGLGIGDLDQIEILGMEKQDFDKLNFQFHTKRSLIVRWDQRIRNTTYRFRPLKPLHWLLFHTPLFGMFIAASEVYHDWLWYPTLGKSKIKKFSTTNWGQLWESYDYGDKPKSYPKIKNWNKY